ncbi:hypothetical protein ACFQRB_04395 [Halobaculum litoreum]|uniref:Uncharacterized protein n=1 Tax=Halobaculum litoreum TaxID=3031998 RepID=A0ABD5XR38_9EURY
MEPFLDGYRRLKTTSVNRRVVASDLRAALNPVTVLAPDEEAEAIVEDIGARLFRYIDRDTTDHLRVTDLAFHDSAGVAADVLSLRGSDARVRGTSRTTARPSPPARGPLPRRRRRPDRPHVRPARDVRPGRVPVVRRLGTRPGRRDRRRRDGRRDTRAGPRLDRAAPAPRADASAPDRQTA